MKTTFEHNPQSQTITVKKGESRQFVFVTNKGVETVSQDLKPTPIQLTFDLKGSDSDIEVIGLVLGHGTATIPFNINLNHISAKTTGRVWLKSVLSDSARQTINAMISIPKGAVGTDSYLSHRTLVLSHQARTRTIPSLEILEDDVKASHAATVGKVDAEQMFYLQSRGLNPVQSRKIIIDGFMEDLVAKIKDEGVQEKVRKLIK